MARKIDENNILAIVHPELVAEWHPTKNGTLTPEDVAPFSRRKVWWRCSKGHEWETSIQHRSYGNGCPYCGGRKTLAGFNDLATVRADIAAQWHPILNGALTPQMVTAGSKKKVWWVCDKGHEWQAVLKSRTGSVEVGCPVCSGKKVVPGINDLATAFPDIAAQWHPELNGDLTPQKVTAGSNKKVWWVCDKGHEYQMNIGHRALMSRGCPYCSGKRVLPGYNDLATKYPKIAAQWYSDLNGELTPEMVTVSSHKKVWWRCEEGHAWKAVISSRTGKRKHGCPVCAGKVKGTKRGAKRYGEKHG